jgi:hypothetical protein
MKKILILIIIIFLVILAVFAYIMLNKSAQGLSQAQRDAALAKLLGRKLNLSDKAPSKEYIPYKGKYVSFMYPKDATPFDEQNKPEGAYFAPNALESFTFSLSNPFLWASIEVLPMNTGTKSLEDYSGIIVRKLDPNTYKQSNISIAGKKGLQFDKKTVSSGSDKAAFFLVNSRIYVVYVSGSSANDLLILFNKLTSSLKFL